MQPLPERVVVDLDISDRSKRNLMLADRTQTALSMAPPKRACARGSSGAINTERSSQCPVVSGL
jgi:hypothetical protein